MSDLSSLRAAVRRASGASRARPLAELTQKLIECYQEAGPGQPAARPLLDEAIDTIDEAIPYFAPSDGMHLEMVALRGWLHGTRHVAHGSPARDRTTGIADLQQGLRASGLPPATLAIYRMTLGQLYLAEAVGVLRSPDLHSMLLSGSLPPSMGEDVERAAAVFEAILAGPALAPEVGDAARLQLRIAGALRTMLTGVRSADPIDRMNKIMESMAAFQQIHQEQVRLIHQGGAGPVRSFYLAEQIAAQPGMERPVSMVEVDDPAEASESRPASQSPTPVPGDQDVTVLRRRLRQRIAAGGDLIEALDALLVAAAAAPTALVDDLVALATAVADAGGANPTDHLLLAVGLGLRGTRAGDAIDLDEAVNALLRSVAGRRVVPPDVLRVTRRLASMIDEADPARGAAARLARSLP